MKDIVKTGASAMTAYVLVYCTVALLTGWLTDYTVSYWLVYAGKPDTFHYWHGYLIALIPVAGQASVPAAIITFIVSFFI